MDGDAVSKDVVREIHFGWIQRDNGDGEVVASSYGVCPGCNELRDLRLKIRLMTSQPYMMASPMMCELCEEKNVVVSSWYD